MLVFVTFLLAIIGYAGLTAAAVAAAWGRLSLPPWRAVVAVIVTHVIMVWGVRYQWEFSEATRDGYGGFVLFHGALLAILASAVAPVHAARWLIWAAFLIVTLGAVAATFTEEVVGIYRIPVLLLAVTGLAGMVWGYLATRLDAGSAVP